MVDQPLTFHSSAKRGWRRFTKQLDLKEYQTASATFRCLKCCINTTQTKEEFGCIKAQHQVMKMEVYNKMKRIEQSGIPVGWDRFPDNHSQNELVMSTDASYPDDANGGDRDVGKSAVVRISTLEFVFAFTERRPKRNDEDSDSNNMAEAESVILGIKVWNMLKRNCSLFEKVKIYTDSKLVADAFNKGRTTHPDFKGKLPHELINRMRKLAKLPLYLPNGELEKECEGPALVAVEHIRREINPVADAMAKLEEWSWHEPPNQKIAEMIEDDKYFCRYYKRKLA